MKRNIYFLEILVKKTFFSTRIVIRNVLAQSVKFRWFVLCLSFSISSSSCIFLLFSLMMKASFVFRKLVKNVVTSTVDPSSKNY